MTKRWTFEPEEASVYEYKAYKPRKRDKKPNWVAPEHSGMVKDMKRDFPRDDLGRPLPNSKKDQLVLDNRPTIMVPERPKIYLTLEERSSISAYR